MELRKQKELEFHNKREIARKLDKNAYKKLTTNRKFYSIERSSSLFYKNWISVNCKNKEVLDYCCGTGETSVLLAKNKANVTGIDISDESIKTCKELAKKENVEKNTSFFAMDAEKTTFKNNSFDVIFCAGVLHHLDIQKSYSELARIIKKNGKIICIEPLAYNPMIQLYRKMTPNLRTEWEAKHILHKKDIYSAKKYFNKIEKKFFHFFTIAGVPFRNLKFFSFLLFILEKIDFIILKLPFIKWWAWQIIFVLSNPKKS